MVSRPLFNLGHFELHSGARSDFLIDCSALTDEDMRALALKASQLVGSFTHVEGIPNGGLRFAEFLAEHCELGDGVRRLLVDDVWTTGSSMQDARIRREPGYYDVFLVIFARRRPARWCRALFIAGEEF